jgi:hypothetical protein
MPVSKARKRLKKNGQQLAGRFSSARFGTSQQMALRLIGRAALIISVCVLASSTLSDPLQKLADETIVMSARTQDIPKYRQQERLALLRRTAQNADGVRGLSPDELALLFGTPTLKREEPEVESWHFTSGECALDVYFPRKAVMQLTRHPVYAEYRVRGDAGEEGLIEGKQALDHKSCVKSLFSHAKFPDMAG